MKDIQKLVKICNGKNVYIQTHNFPDPDAISSAFGLQRLLGHFGVESTLCYEGRIDLLNTMKMLKLFNITIYSDDQLKDLMTDKDVIICVDSQKNGGNIKDLIGKEVACIDHHPTFVPVEYQYEDIRIAGACASLIASYYQELGIVPDVDVATALSYGIRMDTQHLTRGVTPLDIDMFAYLYPLSDQEELGQLERNHLELKDLRAFGSAIDSIEVHGNIAFATVPFACPDALVAILSDFILSVEEITIAVVQCYRKDEIKFSVRSENPEIHAGYLTRGALDGVGNGGGHKGMAGGTIKILSEDQWKLYSKEWVREQFLERMKTIEEY